MKNVILIICLVGLAFSLSGCRSLCDDCGPANGLLDGARDSVMMAYNTATTPVNIPSYMLLDVIIIPIYDIDDDSWVWP
jgi:hypothetical protein